MVLYEIFYLPYLVLYEIHGGGTRTGTWGLIGEKVEPYDDNVYAEVSKLQTEIHELFTECMESPAVAGIPGLAERQKAIYDAHAFAFVGFSLSYPPTPNHSQSSSENHIDFSEYENTLPTTLHFGM